MKKILLIQMILIMVLTTGCWDMIEINQRIFPYSVGYDLSENEHEQFNITFNYPNINALGKNASQEKRVHTITSQASDIFAAVHHVTSRLQKPIYNKHLKVLVLQEDVARNSHYVVEIVDGINRDYIINKTLQLVVVRESAEELLKSLPNSEEQENIEGTLVSLLQNQQESSQFTPKRLTDFIEDMDERGASVVPVVHPKEDEVELSGGAIFKDFGFVGYVDSNENKAIAILAKEIREDGFHTEFNGVNLSILATNFDLKKRLEESENLKLTYSVEIEGQIHEYTLADGTKIDNQEIIKAMEEALANEIQMDLNKTIQRLQKEYQADVIKAADYIKKYHNKLWTQVEDNWDEVFANAEIKAEVVVKIRRRGLTK